jgi:acetyl esterase/lipase
LAAYLYLLIPPKDAGFEPLSPKNIVISGDSAGGGLSMALGLAIRDAGLPLCAGIIGWVNKISFLHNLKSLIIHMIMLHHITESLG